MEIEQPEVEKTNKQNDIIFPYKQCVDSNGSQVDISNLIPIKIEDNKLDLFDIYKDDVVFVRPITISELSNIKLPKTVAINHEGKTLLLRAWKIVNLANNKYAITNAINDLFLSREFKASIYKDVRFVSVAYTKDYMLNIANNMPKSCFNITLVTYIDKYNNWYIDYIPTTNITGIAKYVFHKDNFYK